MKILRAFGANLLLTPAEEGVAGAVKKLEELLQKEPDKYFPTRQFENPINPKVHYEKTAREVLEQMGELPSLFVAGIGTGGTFTGMAKRFKEENPSCFCVAVEPKECAVLSGGKPAPHKIQGIGAGFVPKVLDTSLIDMVYTATFEEAKEYARRLAREFGVFGGISAGANVAAAVKVARERGVERGVITVIPDTGERYLSTELF
jgi:cysteine synthase A